MGLFDFVKDAGERLFGGSDEPEVKQRDLDDVMADKRTAEKLTHLVTDMDMGVENLHVKFREGRATLQGSVPRQADGEKVVLIVGNTQGVAQVDNQMSVRAATAAPEASAAQAPAEAEAKFYTVQSGDSLSKIAKAQYGDAMKYPVIFEANKPMLKDPNKIYPGQVLRIPPLEG